MTAGKQIMALANYDRNAPFFDGSVVIEDYPVEVLEIGQSEPGRHGGERHGRMLQHGEFVIAEMSLSSYLMAIDRGLPFTGVPVFPKRLFSISQMWCRRGGPVQTPADLAGKRVGLSTFQTTLSVLAKGDLKRVYGVDWKTIEWVSLKEEVVDLAVSAGVKVCAKPPDITFTDMLLSGELDAVFIPHPTADMMNSDKIVRIFPNPREEELRYFQTYGYCPIMHLVIIRNDAADKHPDLPMRVYEAFEEASAVCRQRWDDPSWSMLVWGRHNLEEEEQKLGQVWVNGIEKNRSNLEWFIEQSLDQGLIRRQLAMEELFHPSVMGT